nr:uncharacterized protein LOC111834094 [Paramormyrops kingsleyae]
MTPASSSSLSLKVSHFSDPTHSRLHFPVLRSESPCKAFTEGHSPEERQHQQWNRLCPYGGEVSHVINHCPVRPTWNQDRAAKPTEVPAFDDWYCRGQKVWCIVRLGSKNIKLTVCANRSSTSWSTSKVSNEKPLDFPCESSNKSALLPINYSCLVCCISLTFQLERPMLSKLCLTPDADTGICNTLWNGRDSAQKNGLGLLLQTSLTPTWWWTFFVFTLPGQLHVPVVVPGALYGLQEVAVWGESSVMVYVQSDDPPVFVPT